MSFLNFSLPASLLVPSTEKYERGWRHLNRLYARYEEIQTSENFVRYEELHNYVASPEYKEELLQIRSLKYEGSKEQTMERRVAELRKYKEIKHYRKTGDTSTEYVKEYLDLQEHIHTPSFKKHKAYLKDKKRYVQSDQYQNFLEYKRLAKSENIKTYFRLQKKYGNLFAELQKSETLFDDEFRNEQMASHWTVNPLQSEHSFKQAYSQSKELQCVTPGANISQQNGILSICTRQEDAKGMAWDEKLGFVPRQYQYTSGMATTGNNFLFSTGTIEVRLRFSNVKNIYHSFWLGSDQRLPFVSAFTYCNKMLEMGVYGQDGKVYCKRKKIAFSDNSYYVLCIEINSRNIIWRINGKNVFESPNNLTRPMSLGFSSGVIETTNNEKLPTAFEIDWVRVFNNPIIRKVK